MAIAAAVVTSLVATEVARAQSITSGGVSGVVRGADGRAVGQALVTVSPLGTGSGQGVSTSPAGAFRVGFLVPGSYEIRVEAAGYRPLVARVLTVSGGDSRTLTFTLTREPPPVMSVDTIILGPTASSRWRPGGVRLGGNEITGLPHRFEDVASITSLATAFDESLGSQGLPGDMTLIVADGIPYYRAPHPAARSEALPDGLFPRSALGGVTAYQNLTDIELAGSASGYLSLATRASTPGRGVEIDGAYSADPLWSSKELSFETPSLSSYQGGARGTFTLSPNEAQLVVSTEMLRQDTPLAPRIDESLATDLSMLDPALLGSLVTPAVETFTRYSGLARLDVRRNQTSSFFLRGAGSYAARDFDGAGPVSLAGAVAPEEQSSAFSVATGFVTETSRTTTLEVRAGASGNFRDFDPAVTGVSPGYLVESGTPLGVLASASGTSSRLDFVFIPVVRYKPGLYTFEFGATARGSSHTMSHSAASRGDFLYTDPAALFAGRGFGRTTSAPEASFGTREFGIFTGVEGKLGPDVTAKLGGRFDYEVVAGDGPMANGEWQALSGLVNDDYPDTFNQFGVRGSLTWAPVGGSTSVSATASLQDGDVDTRAWYQLFAESLTATSTRFAGSGMDWPTAEIPMTANALPALTMVGPDTRAPRTTSLVIGVSQGLGEQASIFLRGSTRRTDFLMRRRDLNAPIIAQATDPGGRPILGTLVQDGGLVTTTSDDARRFAEFSEVWALDPDGWSEYVGVTAGLEHSSQSLDVYASYTWSETTDNWIGAASGSIGGTLAPGVPEASSDWSEGTSDFDVPHRVAGSATISLGKLAISAAYHFRSGRPFTPGYRFGVDANGDGSIENDVALVPDAAQLAAIMDTPLCLSSQAEGFAARNSCREPGRHSLDVRLRVALGAVGGQLASLTLDGLNLIESSGGVVDRALLLVDPAGSITTSTDGSTITIPTVVNPDFGKVVYPSTRGRMLRVGLRIGG